MTKQTCSTVRLHETRVGRIILCDRLPTVEECVRTAGAKPGTNAAEFVARCWHFLFGRIIDVKEEYSRYYMTEYATLRSFLHRKCGFEEADLDFLGDAIESSPFVGIELQTALCRDGGVYNLFDYHAVDDEEFVMKAVGAEYCIGVDNEDTP